MAYESAGRKLTRAPLRRQPSGQLRGREPGVRACPEGFDGSDTMEGMGPPRVGTN